MAWLNTSSWRALQPGQHIIEGKPHTISVVDCGDLVLPSGRLVAKDPFVTLGRSNTYYLVPVGAYPVRVTIDETIGREMYVSLILSPIPEVRREFLVPYKPDGERFPMPDDDEGFYGIGVDAGTVCFVDDEAVRHGMPEDEGSWHESLFENETEDCWFALMDNPKHIRAGLANIRLPLGSARENIIISHSGWGDGFYPVVGGSDAQGRLVTVHIDLLVHPDEE